jgi:inositol oxygenase
MESSDEKIGTIEKKKESEFRNYIDSVKQDKVKNFYYLNHKYQSYEAAKEKLEKYRNLHGPLLSIWEAIDLLNELVDKSDPDMDQPQIIHCLQTAEAIRKEYPDDYPLQVVGLIHDLGKILNHPRIYNEEDYFTVGDTFPLGCSLSDKIVFYDFFKKNPDWNNPLYSTKYGIYSPNIGFENILMSWGHDEYMYRACMQNKCTLPDYALYIIRLHSFYAWHQEGAYEYLANVKDQEMLKYLKLFQKFDLYSKSPKEINIDELKPYYQELIKKYFPNEILQW